MAWLTKKPDYKVSDEIARAQVTLILEHYQIDVEGIPDADQKRATSQALEKLVGFVRQGMIEVRSDPFKVTQNLLHPPAGGNAKPIEYEELRGEHHIAMDAFKTDAIYKRIFALMVSLSGWGGDVFSKIEGIDLSATECLGLLFLSA